MSRPFSYNDENFTVIGNVLFCHIKIKKVIPKFEHIVEIPPAIYARMLFTTQKFNKVNYALNVTSSSNVDISVMQEGKKYFLFTDIDVYGINGYLVGFLFLKTFKELIIYGIFLPQPEYEHHL